MKIKLLTVPRPHRCSIIETEPDGEGDSGAEGKRAKGSPWEIEGAIAVIEKGMFFRNKTIRWGMGNVNN